VTYDSIYPEFFRTGLGRLRNQGARNGDFLGLFSALEHFRRDLTERPDVASILKVTELYVLGLELFETIGFFIINPASFAFDLAQCSPPDRAASLERLVAKEIKAGRFAWALRQNAPTFFPARGSASPLRGVFHTLGVRNQRLGMFCGLLKSERAPSQEITFNLLSILLGACSDALAGVRTTAELRNQVLAANDSLQRTLRENEILALIPAESPNPVLRLSRTGLVLYSNQAGAGILRSLGWRVGDLISGDWLARLTEAFERGTKAEFEASFHDQVFVFLIVPVPAAGYANFYGTDITARKKAQTERECLIVDLQEALAKVKTLSGLVPICAWCKKVRDDRGFWNEVEVYVQSHSGATFSHGVCPNCRTKWLAGDSADGGQKPGA
jgi:hypothetical protein